MILAKRHKYGAKRTVVDGISFASKAEAARYAELRMLEKGDAIMNLQLQPVFPCVVASARNPDGDTACFKYVADFSYVEDEWLVVEDVKGVRTPVYKLKIKLFRICYPGVKFVEITKGRKTA